MAEKEKNIEDILDELDSIVNEVESEVMPLEKMVDRITYASKLIKQCRKKLNTMNAKIELMFKDDGEQGEFVEFDPTSERSQAAGTEKAAPKITKKKVQPVNDQQDDLPF